MECSADFLSLGRGSVTAGSPRSPSKEAMEEGPMNLAYRSVHSDLIYILLKVHIFSPG